MKRLSLRVAGLTLAVAGVANAPLAQAGGMAMFVNGVKQVGGAFSAGPAGAEDTATVAYNPAGLLRLQGTQVSGGVNLLQLDGRFDGVVERTLIPGDDGRVDGAGRADLDTTAVVPHLYWTRRLSPQSAVGLGLYVPYGSSTSYRDGWAGRYHALETDFTALNLSPVFAFQASERLSVGVGAIVQYFDARLTNQIDVGYLVARGVYDEVLAETGDEQAARAAMEGVIPPLAHEFDVYNEITGDSLAYGLSLSLLWEPWDGLRLGASYRSDSRHLVEGRARRPEVHDPAYAERLEATLESVLPDAELVPQVMELALGPAGAMGGPLQADIHLPESIALGVHYDLTSRLALHAGATWIRWSRIQEFRFEYSDDSLRGGGAIGAEDEVRRRDLVQPLNWQDAWTYGIGATYRYRDNLTLRGGLAFDQTPIPEPAYRTPRAPDNDRTLVSLGASYALTGRLSIDAAYMLMRFQNSRVASLENPAGTQHEISGEFRDVHAHLAGLQLNYAF